MFMRLLHYKSAVFINPSTMHTFFIWLKLTYFAILNCCYFSHVFVHFYWGGAGGHGTHCQIWANWTTAAVVQRHCRMS